MQKSHTFLIKLSAWAFTLGAIFPMAKTIENTMTTRRKEKRKNVD